MADTKWDAFVERVSVHGLFTGTATPPPAKQKLYEAAVKKWCDDPRSAD